MIYLSRLILNPRSRQVQHELADPYEMHRTICRAFPGEMFKDNQPSGILFRVDVHPLTGIPTLLVQSHVMPNWSYLLTSRKDYMFGDANLLVRAENPAVKQVDLQLRAGQVLAFRLRANPTKRLKEGAKRIGLFHEEDQLAWLGRKIEAAGGMMVSAHVTGKANLRGKLFTEKNDERRMQFISAQFDGMLQVKDPALLVKAIESGICSAKGFGFGLLSLAPVRG